ncbi:MAG: hypothetical protein AABY87_09485 [bacterium]
MLNPLHRKTLIYATLLVTYGRIRAAIGALPVVLRLFDKVPLFARILYTCIGLMESGI